MNTQNLLQLQPTLSPSFNKCKRRTKQPTSSQSHNKPPPCATMVPGTWSSAEEQALCAAVRHIIEHDADTDFTNHLDFWKLVSTRIANLDSVYRGA